MSDKKTGPLVLDLSKNRHRLAVIRDHQLRLDLGFEIQPGTAQEPDYYFMSPIFLFQTCLPHSQISDEHLDGGSWVRRDGEITLKLHTALRDNLRLPCGKLPRQFLMWLTNAISVAPRSLTAAPPESQFPAGSQIFHIEATLGDFCRSVGVDPSGGKRGSGRALIEQMIRLMSCTFSVSRETKDSLSVRHLHVSSAMKLSWNDGECTPAEFMRSLNGGFILSADFIQEVQHRRMMVPPAHITAICKGKSPLRIDIYHWLLMMNYQMFQYRRDQIKVPWVKLYRQFGPTCSKGEFMRSFRDEFEWIRKNLMPDVVAGLGDSEWIVLRAFNHPAPLRYRNAS